MDFLIVDPIPVPGGSKTATRGVFESAVKPLNYRVYGRCKRAWGASKYINTQAPARFTHTQGWRYYLQLLVNVLKIVFLLLREKPRVVVGCSAPHVDAAAALAARLVRLPYVQFIHGPCPSTRLSGWVLKHAERVFALHSVSFDQTPSHLVRFSNGIDLSSFESKHAQACGILWAASDMYWKRLDLFVEATRERVVESKVTVACLPVSGVPLTPWVRKNTHIRWHLDPPDLNSIRQEHDVFVSTAHQEPFGLSILEAMAVGLCPVIPSDGAFWDRRLEHGVNCLKYTPSSAKALAEVLDLTAVKPEFTAALGLAAQQVAQHFDSHCVFAPIHDELHDVLDRQR